VPTGPARTRGSASATPAIPGDPLAPLLADGGLFDAVIEEVRGREIRIGDRWLVDYASCNYLGFDLDQEIMSEIDRQIHRWGTHPSWSRMLGNPRLYPEIEERLTELLGAPDTLVLPTITHIHSSVIPALVGAGAPSWPAGAARAGAARAGAARAAKAGTVLLDTRAHRTIYDACGIAAGQGAQVRRFRATDPDQLVDLLADAPGPRLVCLDGVNSMTGNLPDVPTLARLCRTHDALLYLDDAHGFGVIGERASDESSPYGRRGNSIVRHQGETYDGIVLVGGFSKAYSSLLAFVALPTALKTWLKVAAAPYLYSGPSPTASLAGVLAGFAVNAVRGDALRAHLHRLTSRVLGQVGRLGLLTLNTTGTPIIELPLAPQADLAEVVRRLWQRGVYVTPAAYPLVPRDQVGIRLQLTAAHTDEQVDQLNATLAELAVGGYLRRRIPRPRRRG
jgi:8-amino-7-oxononanoate synthase